MSNNDSNPLWRVVEKFGSLAAPTNMSAGNDGVEPLVMSTPRMRARAAGKMLVKASLGWGALSVLGAIFLMAQTLCTDQGSYSCYETSHPYVAWAIASLCANLLVVSFLYTIGTYVEAQMTPVETESA